MRERPSEAGSASDLRSQPEDGLEAFVESYLLSRRPVISETDDEWDRFREFLSAQLSSEHGKPEVFIIGSALMGSASRQTDTQCPSVTTQTST